METSTIIYILIGAFIIWVLFIRQINPSNKTDAQLIWMHDRAHRNFMRTLKPSKELELINEEMKKRGLLENTDLTSNSLNKEEQRQLDEANRIFEESGMQEQMKQLFASGNHEKMINKVLETAITRNTTQEEASNYLNNLFNEASKKHQESGLSEEEADQLALSEVYSVEIKNT